MDFAAGNSSAVAAVVVVDVVAFAQLVLMSFGTVYLILRKLFLYKLYLFGSAHRYRCIVAFNLYQPTANQLKGKQMKCSFKCRSIDCLKL